MLLQLFDGDIFPVEFARDDPQSSQYSGFIDQLDRFALLVSETVFSCHKDRGGERLRLLMGQFDSRKIIREIP